MLQIRVGLKEGLLKAAFPFLAVVIVSFILNQCIHSGKLTFTYFLMYDTF